VHWSLLLLPPSPPPPLQWILDWGRLLHGLDARPAKLCWIMTQLHQLRWHPALPRADAVPPFRTPILFLFTLSNLQSL